MNFVEIGSGISIAFEKNNLGGYDVFLRTNQTEQTSYVRIAQTADVIQLKDFKCWV